MKTDAIRAAAVSLALLGSLVLSPTPTLADGPRDLHDGRRPDARPFLPRPVVPPPGFVMHPPHPVLPRPFVHRPFIPFRSPATVYYVAPPASYASPGYYSDGSSGYYSPAPVYDPPVMYSPSWTTDSVAPTLGVIEYPTGRYELRGDGVTTPYTWVWIPNPPPPAPSARVPDPPPGPPADTPSPARQRALYRWTDAQGTVYWTDNLDSIPGSYRTTAQQVLSR